MDTGRNGPVAVRGRRQHGGWGGQYVFARSGREVRVHDAAPAVRSAVPRSCGGTPGRARRLDLLSEAPGVVMARITVAETLGAAIAGAVHVQENVPERLDPQDAGLPCHGCGWRRRRRCSPVPHRRCRIRVPGAALPGAHAASWPIRPTRPISCPSSRSCRPPSPIRGRRAHPRPHGPGRAGSGGAATRGQRLHLQPAARGRAERSLLDAGAGHCRCGVHRSGHDLRLGLRWSIISAPFETADLNYQGGLEEHARRMGERYRQMAPSGASRTAWTRPSSPVLRLKDGPCCPLRTGAHGLPGGTSG